MGKTVNDTQATSKCSEAISITEAREKMTEIANRVIYRGERILIKRSSKLAFAIVPLKDVQILEALEERIDLQEAEQALKDGDFVGLEELKKELGI